MKKTLQVISIILTYIIPFLIIMLRHVYTRASGFNFTLMGWLLVIILGITYFKLIGKKVKVWDIQGVNKAFVFNFYRSKTMLILIVVFFVFKILHDYYEEVSFTILLLLCTLVVGWLFGLIAILRDKIE